MSEQQFIAKGRHAAVCRVIQFGETENGKPQIAIGFEIYSPNADDPDQDAGRSITYFGSFDEPAPGKTKGAFDFTIEALKNCGWTGDDLTELPTLAETGQLNQEVSIVVATEEYPPGSGDWSSKVKWVNRPGGGAVKLKKPMSAQDVKTFAASMKSRIRSVGGGTGTGASNRPTQSAPSNGGGGSRQTQPHPNAPGGRLDDIPFAVADMAHDVSPIARCVR